MDTYVKRRSGSGDYVGKEEQADSGGRTTGSRTEERSMQRYVR